MPLAPFMPRMRQMPESTLSQARITDYKAINDDTGETMASITIRNLGDPLKSRLRIQAAVHGRSMEEARDILRAAFSVTRPQPSNLATAIRSRFADTGGVAAAIILLFAAAQHPASASSAVPIVVCQAERQGDDVPPLLTNPKTWRVDVDSAIARGLAYYVSSIDGRWSEDSIVGILGPRGWDCYGSFSAVGSGMAIYKKRNSYATWGNQNGPAVVLQTIYSDTSGRFDFAEILARLFPKLAVPFIHQLQKSGDSIKPTDYPMGPYAYDKLKYIGSSRVEFMTPANKEGIGNESIRQSALPIFGVVDNPEGEIMTVLAVSLPPTMTALKDAIIKQTEISLDKQ